ncbi:MAG: hypothetical protein HRU38_06950 [Saccharospirillaceae bacterium]|nr:hypothetical protein [Saccharospirillaceae bacterium]
MKTSFPLAVYPSQLNAFKEKSDQLAKAIADALSQKKISAFKRNDYMSVALGYKSHNDLINSAKFRHQADDNEFLIVFDRDLSASIVHVFAGEIEGLTTKLCSQIVRSLRDVEQKAYSQAGLDDSAKSMHGAIFDDESMEVLSEYFEDDPATI